MSKDQCKVQIAFAKYVANVTKTAKRCYIDATRIEFNKPECSCSRCKAKLEKEGKK